MKIKIIFTLLIFATSQIAIASDLVPITDDIPPDEQVTAIQPIDELTVLDQYIAATTRALTDANALRAVIADYQKLQQRFAENMEDHLIALKMIKEAHNIQERILHQHLTPLFGQTFLDELALFSKMATKKGIPPL